LPDEKKAAIETALADLKAAHAAKNFAQIDSATESLNNAWMAASQEMYAATQEAGADAGAGATNGQSTAGGSSTEDITDVDYEEVTDKK